MEAGNLSKVQIFKQNWLTIWNNLTRTQSLKDLQSNEGADHQQLKKTLTALDLIFIGIGGTIGSGLFVLTGLAASQFSGPAVVLSYLIAGFVAALSALCYCELSSLIPVSGSAYSYTYHTLGELVAWFIGWDLILEYTVGAATVSVGFSGYVVSFFQDTFGIQPNFALTSAPLIVDLQTEQLILSGAVINLPAVLSILFTTFILVLGIRESARTNAIAVIIKLLVILIFIFATIPFINKENWQPFVPPNEGKFGQYGVSGVFQGATLVFFAFIGFDATSTASQECKNPQRDLPIGIITSLTICTVLYIIVSLVMTGVVSYTKLNVPHPFVVAIEATGMKWLASLVEFGAVAGLLSVLLVELLGQSRIFFSMAKDGLLPPFFSSIHPKYKTPYRTTIITGVVCAIMGGLFPVEVLGELTSVGTLFAFFFVCLGVTIMRVQKPDLERKFKVPFGPYLIPLTGAASCLLLVCTANPQSLVRLLVWMALGLLVYVFYGYNHSKLRTDKFQTIEKSISSQEQIDLHNEAEFEAIQMEDSNNPSQSSSNENLIHNHKDIA